MVKQTGPKTPKQYLDYFGEAFQATSTESELDPTNYHEGKSDTDAEECQQAMNREMESMYSNEIWDLAEASKGIKPNHL